MIYGEICITIHLSLNCDKTKIKIDTDVKKNSAFIIAKNCNDDEVFRISDINCVYKLLYVLRDILPNGAFINKDELNIVFTFIECVKTCEDTERQKFCDLMSEDYISRKILCKNPSLDEFKIKQLLNVNKIDLLCISNLNLLQGKSKEQKTLKSNINSNVKNDLQLGKEPPMPISLLKQTLMNHIR